MDNNTELGEVNAGGVGPADNGSMMGFLAYSGFCRSRLDLRDGSSPPRRRL